MQLVWHSFWRSHTCISSLNQKWVKIFNALAWPHIIIKLNKSLYGLKQALRAWYSRIDSYLQRLGFSKREVDPNLYFKIVKNNHWYWFSMLMICSLLERTFDCLVQEGAHLWFRDERLRSYALLSCPWSLAKERCDFPFSREIHYWCITMFWHDGLQIHDYTDGFQFEEITWVKFWIGSSGPHFV